MIPFHRAVASLGLFLPALVAAGKDCSDFSCHKNSNCVDGDADYGRIATWNYTGSNFLDIKSYKGQHCECPEGWSGVSCKRKVKICSEEDKFACFHGSECVHLGESSGAKSIWGCDCITAKWVGEKEFFGGQHCEYRANEVCARMDEDGLEEGRWFCTNGGTCQNNETGIMKKCRCPDDWFGPHCEYQRSNFVAEQFNPKQCQLKCRNNGKCKFGLKDYGMHDKKNDASATFTEETHSNGMHCVCPDGFTGLICQIPAKKCGNRLWCYNGAECAKTTLDDGTTKKYCDCAPAATNSESYAGLACQHQSGVFCNPDEGNRKDMSFCVNGGTCWEDGGQHLGCDCKGNWSGQHCEFHEEKDPAENTKPENCNLKCKNGGGCRKGVKDYGKLEEYDVPLKEAHKDFEHCYCPVGWTGVDCSVQVEFCSSNSQQVCFYGSKCEATGEVSANGKDEFVCNCENTVTPDAYSVAGRYCEHYATVSCL
mmetsp:Transcript_24754/g.72492  ORF Transcript_24754/g.72492 Transcript_24754/m.72492 type:complete len:481 (-) Transcript_24754:624-2066(-)